MWKYIRRYLIFAIIAGLFMIGEVLMDLVQPGANVAVGERYVPISQREMVLSFP